MSPLVDIRTERYAVVYLDGKGRSLTLARDLDATGAAERAKQEARRLQAGRMFAAGSSTAHTHTVLVIADEGLDPAA